MTALLLVLQTSSGQSQDVLSASAWVTAIATVVLTAATIALAFLTWRLAEATRTPSVVATIEPNGWAPTILLDIHLVNEGSASAFDIEIGFDPALPKEREGQHHLERTSVLRSGQQMVSTLVEAKLMIDQVYEVTLSWARKPGGRKIVSIYPIDVSAIKGMRYINGGDPMFRIAEDVKKLREQIDRIAGGSKRLQVDSFSAQDRQAEHAVLVESYRNHSAPDDKTEEQSARLLWHEKFVALTAKIRHWFGKSNG